MKQLDKCLLQLLEVLEPHEIVLRTPILCLSFQRQAELGDLWWFASASTRLCDTWLAGHVIRKSCQGMGTTLCLFLNPLVPLEVGCYRRGVQYRSYYRWSILDRKELMTGLPIPREVARYWIGKRCPLGFGLLLGLLSECWDSHTLFLLWKLEFLERLLTECWFCHSLCTRRDSDLVCNLLLLIDSLFPRPLDNIYPPDVLCVFIDRTKHGKLCYFP